MNYPEFLDSSRYLAMNDSVPELDQYKAMMANITRIHLLTTKTFSSFDELIRTYLESGVAIFGMETGIVSRIDKQEVYHVCDVVSPLDVLEKDQEFALEDTYCREVVKSQSVLGFPEVGKLDYMNCHPVYQNLKLEAYLSAPIYVNDVLFGTLNFTSVSKREYGFSTHEHDLILLMANAIGNYIALRQNEEKLLELNEKMKRFVGYVAHDLRNPIGSIIALSRVLSRPNVDPERALKANENIQHSAEYALDIVSTILDNAAIKIGKISLNFQDVELKGLFSSAAQSVQQLAEEKDISLNISTDIGVRLHCDRNRILQSLVNLLTNAVKYAPGASTIHVSSAISSEQTRCEITITNQIELVVSDGGGEERVLYKSVGFGLDIIRDLLVAHGSELEIQQTESDFTARFYLPVA
ncbi:MAG: GAF domain-containing sensor histidine kinase [Cellvibrionaceae bacterium]